MRPESERRIGALARLDGRLRQGEAGPWGEAALMAVIAAGLIGWMLLKLPMIARATLSKTATIRPNTVYTQR